MPVNGCRLAELVERGQASVRRGPLDAVDHPDLDRTLGGIELQSELFLEGLTTAASIWVIAATGVAVGAGLWRTSLIVVVISLLLLAVGNRIDGLVHRLSKPPNHD